MNQATRAIMRSILFISFTVACNSPAPIPAPETLTASVATLLPNTAQNMTTPVAMASRQAALAPQPSALVSTLTSCPLTAGWSGYSVKYNDTLISLARQTNTTIEEIMHVNCLSSSVLTIGQRLVLPERNCATSVPSDWNNYEVVAGDTLSTLAAQRDVTVEAVKQVNCLISDSLQIGQRLYLPRLLNPSVLAPSVSIPQATLEAIQSSVFDLRDARGPQIQVAAGSSNQGTFKPCKKTEGRARIDLQPGSDFDQPSLYETGDRFYFYACEFKDPSSMSAYLSGPSGSSNLPIQYYLPNPNRPMGNAQRVIPWYAACDLSSGYYTLTVQTAMNESASMTFFLKSAESERILAVPEYGVVGTNFQIYYCGYQTRAGTTISVSLYAATSVAYSQDGNPQPVYSLADTWDVSINSSGWGLQYLQSHASDIARAYYLTNDDALLSAEDWLWLIR